MANSFPKSETLITKPVLSHLAYKFAGWLTSVSNIDNAVILAYNVLRPFYLTRETNMFETFDKIRLAGVGAFSMTRQRAEDLFDEMVKRGEAERVNKKNFVEDLMDTAAKAKQDLETVIAKQLQEAMVKLNLPTRADLARIEAKLDELLKKP